MRIKQCTFYSTQSSTLFAKVKFAQWLHIHSHRNDKGQLKYAPEFM